MNNFLIQTNIPIFHVDAIREDYSKDNLFQ